MDKFNKGDIIIKAGHKVEHIYFIMDGLVVNEAEMRYFKAGHMINHDTLVLGEEIPSDYLAETDLLVLKFESATFWTIMNTFPDFYDDIIQ